MRYRTRSQEVEAIQYTGTNSVTPALLAGFVRAVHGSIERGGGGQ